MQRLSIVRSVRLQADDVRPAKAGHYMEMILAIVVAAILIASGSEAARGSTPDNRGRPDGTTPLHLAARQGDLAAVHLLLRQGAKADVTNRFGITPLWLACIQGSAPVVEALLKAGADPNGTRLDSGETPVMIAARSGHASVVRSLARHGANVNAVERVRGQTALMWAASERHPDVVRVLLEAGADPRAWSRTMSALMFAIRAGDVESTRLLIGAGVDVNEAGRDGTSPLVVAILNARFDVGMLLLEKGANPNVKDPHNSPLHVLTFLRRANNYGLSDVLPRQLPTTGADTFAMARALLAAGADINARFDPDLRKVPKGRLNGLGTLETPDHLSLPNYTIKRLSFAGATPFYVATINGDVDFMRFLAAQGANVTLPSFQNVTPLIAASGVAWFEHPATAEEALEAVKLAYELGNELGAVIANGERKVDAGCEGADALHGAINIGATGLVKWLVENGAPLNAKTTQGMTPLKRALAARGRNADIVAVLREAAEKRGVALEE